MSQLWILDKVREGEFLIKKVDGKKNQAGALTKYVSLEELRWHREHGGQKECTGRHELAPDI